MSDWPHIARTVDAALAAVAGGHRQVLITAPTGAGKTRMMTRLIERNPSAALYTHRRMLLDQTSEVLTAAGVRHGVAAAGNYPDFDRPTQLCSIQTINERCIKNDTWDLHKCDLVLVDEAHNNKSRGMREVLRRHIAGGAATIGFTATPLDCGGIWKHLIVGAKNSELRECGALVFAHTYAPDEPDSRNLKRVKTGEFTEASIVKAIMTPSIFGRVVDHYKRLNPDGRPAILFAPGVAESLWFAQQLTSYGIRAAHIDGDKIWIGGEQFTNSKIARRQLRELSESGFIQVVCNRFVLREGIDWPHLQHGIFATCFGSLTSYLQSGGRLLRAHPSMDHVTIQDHGGNWHRHGSLNSDRQWFIDTTERQIREERKQALREKRELEPTVCVKCGKVRLLGAKCPDCGFEAPRRSRMVVQLDGNLREVRGDIYKPRVESTRPDDVKKWVSCVFRCKNSKRTYRQAAALFYRDTGRWPNKSWVYCPKNESDWFRQVASVPKRDLIQEPINV